jgi:lysozyme
MQTSAQGVAALELEEGVVLRAYRDVTGVWTIGAGLTAASGVVRPKAGMVITTAEATNLMQRALREKYEPAVEVAMSRISNGGAAVERPKQHEFDAGISFHWNTGAIKSASWVKLWLAKVGRKDIAVSLMQWNKSDGKVLPSLTARREREAAMLFDGTYRSATPSFVPSAMFARWGIPLTSTEKAAAREALLSLGYQPGPMLDSVLKDAVMRFQGDHGLTVDGVIGRATLTTLQRRLNARSEAKVTGTTVVATGAGAAVPAGQSDITDALLSIPYVQTVLVAAVVCIGVAYLYRHRDTVAAKINRILPRVAALLRSF